MVLKQSSCRVHIIKSTLLFLCIDSLCSLSVPDRLRMTMELRQQHQATPFANLWQARHDEEQEGGEEDEDEDYEDEEEEDLVGLVVATVRSCVEYDTDGDKEEDTVDEELYNRDVIIMSSRKRCRASARQVMWTDEDGRQHRFTPKSSLWYCIYVAYPQLDDDSFHKKFRTRFLLPYEQFKELESSLESEDSFCRWHEGNVNCTKKEATPLSLLVLCSLRYLGRGWTFDDLSENTAISIEVIRPFFHSFICYGSTVLYIR